MRDLEIGDTVRYRGALYILVGRERRDGSGPWEVAKLRGLDGTLLRGVPYRQIERARRTPDGGIKC